MIGAKTTVNRYLSAVDRHDIDAALALLADDFELRFRGGPTMDREALARAMGWDVGTQGSLEWEVVSEEGAEITVEGTETNEFLRLLGVPPLPFRSRFTVNEDRLIEHQLYEVDWSGVSMEDELAPAVRWAEEHAPGELAEIYPGRKLVYTEEMGRRWVALLKRWKKGGG